MKINQIFLIILATICGSIISVHPAKSMNDGSRYINHSVLSSGKWIQLKVKENAVYKLTYEEIKSMGISDPSKVKIYGYGGWKLDENFMNPYIDDLPEVAVWLSGADNVFNAGEFILFYGKGTVQWKYNSGSDFFVHENNPYSTYGSYFLTESNSGPKIMDTQNSFSTTTVDLTTFDDYAVHERDSIAFISSGRELFGENFSMKTTQNFSLNIPGITADDGKVRLSFAVYPKELTHISLSIGENKLIDLSASPTDIRDTYTKALLKDGIQTWTQTTKNERVAVTISCLPSGQSVANLNFFSINMKRDLQFYGTGYTFFRNKASRTSDVKYTIGNSGAQSMIWEITEGSDVKLVQTTRSDNQLSFGAEKNSALREYVMVDYSKSFPKPEVMGEVKNQDLHGLSPVDLVIIVPAAYRPQANLLAERHRKEGLRVITVQPELIYNEFSSGKPDASAYRRFMKMFYDRATTEDEKPRYLLLFGDGIFDNRHLTKSTLDMDPRYYLLTYQVVESLNETGSFGTDDYFGFLDDNEGVTITSDRLDIGVGRFPVSSSKQATNAANKVINYIDDKYYSEWKNKIIFTADDADSAGGDPYHAKQADSISRYVQTYHPEYMITKSFMDAFKPVDTNGKKTYPDAKKKFLNTLKEGCLMLNYTGHGSVNGWSAEDMLNSIDVRQMNFQGLPLWITATCDFGWFDRPSTAAGEEAFLNAKSAAIALFTTSRVVYSDGNANLNGALVRRIFPKPGTPYLRLGDILRQSKNSMSTGDSNKLNYVLLGDPALMLAYPSLNVTLETVNGESVETDDIFSFKALEKITLTGSITDNDGNEVTNFNGELKTTVFDSKQMISSILPQPSGNFFTFSDYPNRIFLGRNNVVNGKFTVSFRVPLDISYTKDSGKINFYAYDETLGVDANGYYTKYALAGSSDNMSYGDEGPEIQKIFLNSESFENGDNVNETPFFVARVYDKEGINMSGGGVGHDITIRIDKGEEINLNSFYYPDAEVENQGELRFSIPTLPPGKHQLQFKVWNIVNISSTDSIRFNVINGLRPNLYDLKATIVPARTHTNFRLSHDRPESTIEVEVFVYDLTGRLIWNHKETGSSAWLKDYDITWDLTNNGGRKVDIGTYVYRAIINAPEGKEASKARKIIVLRE
jgi:hypothetical protein